MTPAPASSGTSWKRAGVALLVVGIWGGFVLNQPLITTPLFVNNYKLLWTILSVLSATIACSGAFLYWRGRQYAAQAIAESVITDAKPHLLYLRPFRSDYTTIKALGPSLETTEEEQLADVLRPFGELVAIGRPGESLPTPGAARIYTSDEEWKDVVKRQMRATRPVVIRAAVGENVLWELTQAAETIDPQKLLILVLKLKAEEYESFRAKANPILGVSLPEGAILWRFGRVYGFRRVSGFISFAADWKPSFLALKGPYFRSGSYKSLAKYALKPVFERFGVEWEPPPISVSWLIPFVIVGVISVAEAMLIWNGWTY
jgi:hypothetical protein